MAKDEAMMPNQFTSGEPAASGDVQYLRWIEDVKSRYRQSQIKAHLQVNAAVLEFNWYLGHDISEIMRTRIWGSGVLNQVALTSGPRSLKQRVFRRITSIAWVSSTGFIPAKMKLWHKLCHKLRTHWLSHAIAAGFYKDATKPLHNFALTLPKPQGDLACAGSCSRWGPTSC